MKLVTRHVWADDLAHVEENRYTYGVREWYELRKETTERAFAQAKELHSFRYTQMESADGDNSRAFLHMCQSI